MLYLYLRNKGYTDDLEKNPEAVRRVPQYTLHCMPGKKIHRLSLHRAAAVENEKLSSKIRCNLVFSS